MYELIVFDMDGTILDTLDDLHYAVNAAMEKCNLPSRTKEEVKHFIGNGAKKLLERAVGDGKADVEKALAYFRETYDVHCADHTKPYDGVLSLLQTLKEKGVKMAVLSNKPDPAVRALAKTYFDGLFMEAMGENEGAGIRKKPAPDSLLAVMRRLGVSKEKTVYVGDSEVDIQTAKNAGVDSICVTWGFRSRAYLMEEGGEKFADDPAELLQYCEV